MIQLPEEMLNQIFSYCQSPTNQIMKENIQHITSIHKTKVDYLNKMLCILEMNQAYGFIQYNNMRFQIAYYYKCNLCKRYLTTDEYRYKDGLCKSCKILNILFNNI
jgi:hypothetical protein